MFKSVIFIIVLCSVFSSFETKSLGLGDEISFEELMRVCVDSPDPSYMDLCNQRGFQYETLETELYSESNNLINFKSEVVLSGSTPLKQVHHNFEFICVNCELPMSNSQLTSFFSSFRNAFKSAAMTSTFSTKRTKRNGRNTQEPAVNNNGGSFSQDFKNIADGTKTFTEAFSEAYKTLFDDSDDNPIVVLVDQTGSPVALIKVVGDTHTVVSNFSNATTSDDGSMSFTANVSISDASHYLSALSTMTGYRCETVWTGSNEDMVAQTVCY